ncbi:MAG: histidine kinase [Flavobacteriaceae bacterium]
MNNNRIIFLIAISFSLLVNVPRILFLLGNGKSNGLFEVSAEDIIFRALSLFIFCLVVLKFNIDWGTKWFHKSAFLKSCLLSVIILIVWMGLYRNFNTLINGVDSTSLTNRINNYVYFFVTLMLLIISRAVLLNNKSKIDAVEKEQLKQQTLQNELSALKNQVNPHFLFNSLNSLTLLVREDSKTAEIFIKKLSFLYRYILQSKDQNLVTLKEELKFLNSYIFLIKERYRENFNVSIRIDESLLQKKTPTLALQLLVENSVKHNEISAKKPLTVDVYNDDNFLIVKNKIQKRTGSIESTNTGLSNLNNRFQLSLSKTIIIEKSQDFFIVKLPIL